MWYVKVEQNDELDIEEPDWFNWILLASAKHWIKADRNEACRIGIWGSTNKQCITSLAYSLVTAHLNRGQTTRRAVPIIQFYAPVFHQCRLWMWIMRSIKSKVKKLIKKTSYRVCRPGKYWLKRRAKTSLELVCNCHRRWMHKSPNRSTKAWRSSRPSEENRQRSWRSVRAISEKTAIDEWNIVNIGCCNIWLISLC